MGDVVQVNDLYFLCCGMGWRLIEGIAAAYLAIKCVANNDLDLKGVEASQPRQPELTF